MSLDFDKADVATSSQNTTEDPSLNHQEVNTVQYRLVRIFLLLILVWSSLHGVTYRALDHLLKLIHLLFESWLFFIQHLLIFLIFFLKAFINFKKLSPSIQTTSTNMLFVLYVIQFMFLKTAIIAIMELLSQQPVHIFVFLIILIQVKENPVVTSYYERCH